jgi:hypothetical protein
MFWPGNAWRPQGDRILGHRTFFRGDRRKTPMRGARMH